MQGREDRRIDVHQLAVLLAESDRKNVAAVVGLVFGIPLGIAFGRVVWRNLAESFPFVYSPPLALLATPLVIPIALLVANAVAAGPGRRASRIQPAAVLRSE